MLIEFDYEKLIPVPEVFLGKRRKRGLRCGGGDGAKMGKAGLEWGPGRRRCRKYISKHYLIDRNVLIITIIIIIPMPTFCQVPTVCQALSGPDFLAPWSLLP